MDIDAELQDLYAEILLNGAPPGDADAIRRIAILRFGSGDVMRRLQIIHESLELAGQSRNKEVAESRMALAEQMLHEVLVDYRALTTDATKRGIQEYFDREKAHFHQAKYINVAKGYLERIKPRSPKTSREKYLALAREELALGLDDPLADHDRIRTLQNMWNHY